MHFKERRNYDMQESFETLGENSCEEALKLSAEVGDVEFFRDLWPVYKEKKKSFFSVSWLDLITKAAKSGSDELLYYIYDTTRAEGASTHTLNSIWCAAAEEGLEKTLGWLIESGNGYPVTLRNSNLKYGPMYKAAARGSVSILTMFLENGADVNEKGSGGAPLHGAVESKDEAVVGLLLDRGAYVPTLNGAGYTALHLAARLGLQDIVELLIDHGADVNAKGRKDERPLGTAARKGFKAVAQILRSRGAELFPTGASFSALHSAVDEVGSSKEGIKFLIEEGLDVDVKTTDGETPLHWAVRSSSEDIVEYLLSLGADPNIRSKDGLTPLHTTVMSSSHVRKFRGELTACTLRVIQLLAEQSDDEAIHYALWAAANSPKLSRHHYSRIPFYNAFIAQGADPHTQFTDGKSLLFLTYDHSHTHVETKFLLSLGISPKAVDVNGNSILHHLANEFKSTVGARNRFILIIKELVAAGADLQATNHSSETAANALRAQGFDIADFQA
jgi:ankyrin repeat protein